MKFETLTTKLFIHAQHNYQNVMEYRALGCDMSKSKGFGVLVDTVDVEFVFHAPTDQEMLDLVISGLKAEKTKIEADAYIQAKAIQDKIDSLLCIEHKKEIAA